MTRIPKLIATTAILLAAVTLGCSDNTETAENPSSSIASNQGEHGGGEHDHDGGEHGREGRAEHDRDGNEHHGAEGEESGTEFALDQTYDEVRHGARLILKYDAASNSFHGTVENTTEEPLERVRVEVHLSNGKELGPTTPTNLKPGEKVDVKLVAESKDFDGFSAHPEVGNQEHGHGEEQGEHDRD